MITAIREVRRAKGLTLQDVAERCVPPTTAQTIGRLETGTRTVSVGWLNRIATALGVAAADLVTLPDREDVPVVALVEAAGARAPRRPTVAVAPRAEAGAVAVRFDASVGDYRSGDTLWLERLAPDAFPKAVNRDVLAPRPAGRFLFGRLIDRDGDKLHILPPGAGSRQLVVTGAPWIAVARTLVREL
jgi:transcriptional regulator with XRE-family HTH domain